jgi:hypothetical protein
MGFVDFFRRQKSPRGGPIVGLWLAQGIELEVRPDGTMDYILVGGGKRQIMKLTYRIEGDEIVSNQPSRPREERTKFWFEGDELVLLFSGERNTFRRAAP